MSRALDLVCLLAEPKQRQAAARQLAEHFGASALVIFVRDADLDVLVPAPGFPQTLPGGPGWDAFLTDCRTPGQHRGSVEFPQAGTLAAALGHVERDGMLWALLGGTAALHGSAELALPLLGALLRAEQRVVSAIGHSAASRDAARRADALAGALDVARADLERVLRAQRELLIESRENEARRAAVLQSSLDAVISIDPQGKIIEFNPAAERMFAYRGTDMLGRELEQLFESQAAKDALHHMRGQAAANDAQPGSSHVLGTLFEATALRSDGHAFPVEIAITQVQSEVLPTFTSFIRDITQRKQIEAERGRLLAIVGHDLRNPLSAIEMGTMLLLNRGDLPAGHVKTVRRIQSSSGRMTRMIADLLDFERSREGGIPLERKPLRLVNVVTQVIEELEVSHPDRSIRFEAAIDGAGSWDSDRLAQVASNLIGNAIQHSPQDTPILVSLRRHEPGSNVIALHISNQNRGVPIPPDEITKLFEPFRRGKESTGLGLGLYIVQQIAHAHAGHVEVRSVPEATTFSVLLPEA